MKICLFSGIQFCICFCLKENVASYSGYFLLPTLFRRKRQNRYPQNSVLRRFSEVSFPDWIPCHIPDRFWTGPFKPVRTEAIKSDYD